ncbi:GNAT family N-acetyltransferase [Geodermatophilus sp. CPCC 205506]|uniref:GNAT family N-acetyltransferase n=1 Tax=Geodermatophilus sp. CPCC 205506 TaxID=2936596 RepID=UPI003EEF3EC2
MDVIEGAGPGPVPAVSAAGVRVVPEADWDELVRRLGGLDSYTRLAHHRVSALLEPAGTRPVLLHQVHPDGEVALPLLLRPLPEGGGWDATSAYGYGGPVATSPQAAAAFGAALDAWARENEVVTTFLRLHPLLGNASLVPRGGDLEQRGCTVSWDVRPGRDLLSAMHPHHRRAVRKADRAGLEVVVRRPSRLDEFRALYDVTMRRQRAEAYYFFPDAYWEALLTDAERLGVVLVEGRLDGKLVAALLCCSEGAWLHYHLGASADAARAIGASNRCFLAAAEWAQARGTTRFHLGGGVGGDSASSLFVFKHRFDPSTPALPFHVAKLVHDPDRYRELAGTGSTSGFFPPWRRGR